MNGIITDLYENFFNIPEGFHKRKQVKENHEKTERIITELKKALPADKQYLLYDFESTLNFHNYLESVESFHQGMKLGFSTFKELED